MDPLFINAKELGRLFSMSPKAARRHCREHGVLPYDFSKGKRPTLRWAVNEVMQMRDAIQATGKDSQTVRAYTRETSCDKTGAQIWEELSALRQ